MLLLMLLFVYPGKSEEFLFGGRFGSEDRCGIYREQNPVLTSNLMEWWPPTWIEGKCR